MLYVSIYTVHKLVGCTVAPKESNDSLYKLWLMGHILPWEIYKFTDAEKNTLVHFAFINIGTWIYFNQVNTNLGKLCKGKFSLWKPILHVPSKHNSKWSHLEQCHVEQS